MNYSAGQKVRIKSLDWYNKNKDEYGVVLVENRDYMFCKSDTEWCGRIVTIKEVCLNEYYEIEEDFGKYRWTDEMIEGLVEEESLTPPLKHPEDSALAMLFHKTLILPDGYIFKDENGNVINATKIVLEKKKKEYPKTFEECVHTLEGENRMSLEQMNAFRKLIDARNAYWKIAGEEMGLGKPWEPDWEENSEKSIITKFRNVVAKFNTKEQYTFAFPTAKMRDAFYENFKEEIEMCKELL